MGSRAVPATIGLAHNSGTGLAITPRHGARVGIQGPGISEVDPERKTNVRSGARYLWKSVSHLNGGGAADAVETGVVKHCDSDGIPIGCGRRIVVLVFVG